MKLFKVKGELRERHIGFSGKAPFFSCIAIATEEKLAEANEIKMFLAVFQFNFKQLQQVRNKNRTET